MMKEKNKYFAIIILVFYFASCTQQTVKKELTDIELSEYISNDNVRTGIAQIDSLIKHGSYGNRRRAILFYEKGRLLANLEKDLEWKRLYCHTVIFVSFH